MASREAEAKVTDVAAEKSSSTVRLALPKGRMKDEVLKIIAEAGISFKASDRDYRPSISLDNFDTKLLKPQDVVAMLNSGTRDIGFAGKDWVTNLDANLTELMDTGLDKVKLVVASPNGLPLEHFKEMSKKSGNPIRIASEYVRITNEYIKTHQLNAVLVRVHGATESFPPDDADIILDNTATGSTLKANGLEIIDVAMVSSTRLFCHPKSLEDPDKKKAIENFVLLLKSVLEGRKHKMIEFNVPEDKLTSILKDLPSLRSPTVAQLYGKLGFAVKVCVNSKDVPSLLPKLKELGAEGIIVTPTFQIVE